MKKLNEARRKQIIWWTKKVREQAREYCDVLCKFDDGVDAAAWVEDTILKLEHVEKELLEP